MNALAQPPQPLTPPVETHNQQPTPFVTALVLDKRNQVWAGTEEAGVWRYNPQAAQAARWTQYTTKDGLGDDNAYALCCDHQGRIWCGHLNHGVSVFDGRTWHNYNLLDGPIGERVFALATCPTDGDVWIGTSAGLTRYSVTKDNWLSYSRADGLPADQISAVAFDAAGTLYIGTDCDGLAIAAPADNYQQWHTVRGPEQMPARRDGPGLPSNLINAILASRSGVVYVGTTCGLARSRDGGKSWNYARGKDWGDKVSGLWPPPPDWKYEPGATLEEDNITCLAEDAAGTLWVGHWHKGVEAYNPRTGAQLYASPANAALHQDYARAILTIAGQVPLIGWYGCGMTVPPPPYDAGFGGARQHSTAATEVVPPTLPTPAKAPALAELQAMLRRVQTLQTPAQPGQGDYLGEDWRTWGDWVGRYGRQSSVLCGGGTRTFPTDFAFHLSGQLGPHHPPKYDLWRWTYSENVDRPQALYNPIYDGGWDGQWDDHGELYGANYDGPDIWVTAEVPVGVHSLTLFFYNNHAREAGHQFRDYLLELKPYADDLSMAGTLPTLARARVRDFYGPVYKTFMVQGPGKFLIRVARNNSYNTLLQGLFVDRLAGPNTRLHGTSVLPSMTWINYGPPDPDPPVGPDPHLLDKILALRAGTAPPPPVKTAAEQERDDMISTSHQLWRDLDAAYRQQASARLQWPYRLAAYQMGEAAKAPDAFLVNCRWKLRLWDQAQRDQFKEVTHQIHEAFLNRTPPAR